MRDPSTGRHSLLKKSEHYEGLLGRCCSSSSSGSSAAATVVSSRASHRHHSTATTSNTSNTSTALFLFLLRAYAAEVLKLGARDVEDFLASGCDSIKFKVRSYPAGGVFVSPELSRPLLGGKGGFGALLKAVGKRAGKKQTTDFGACRDLNGRRLRHVNDEIKLEKWRRDKEREEEGGGSAAAMADHQTESGIDNWYLPVPSYCDGVSNKQKYKNNKRKMWERGMEEEKLERGKIREEERRLQQEAKVRKISWPRQR